MKNNIKVIKNSIIFFIIFSFFQNTVFAEKEIFFEETKTVTLIAFHVYLCITNYSTIESRFLQFFVTLL